MRKSKIKSEVTVGLTINQIAQLKPLLDKQLRNQGGIIVSSIIQDAGREVLTACYVPNSVALKILGFVDEYYDSLVEEKDDA